MTDDLFKTTAQRLTALRAEMTRHGLDAYLVPVKDAFFNEEIPDRWKRFRFLTGFDPSLGFAVITQDKAALIFEGIYFDQATDYVAKNGLGVLFQVEPIGNHDSLEDKAADWLKVHVPAATQVGYDASLHAGSDMQSMRTMLTSCGIQLMPVEPNLVDAIWEREGKPHGGQDASPIYQLPERFSGESVQARIAKTLGVFATQAQPADALLLGAPSSLCWLLNLRGSDATFSPLPFLRGWLDAQGQVTLFANDALLPADVKQQLQSLNPPAIIRPESEMGEALRQFAASGKRMQIDAGAVPEWFERTIADCRQQAGLDAEGGVLDAPDPIAQLRAIKTESELAGMRQAHLQDGIAHVHFLQWLDEQKHHHPATLSEATIAQKLHDIRAQHSGFKGESFDTISAIGEHSAFVHYGAKSTQPITADSTHLLLDSGAHYYDPHSGQNGTPALCGSTDISRVIPLKADPDPALKKAYTIVLKSHIALASHRFAAGTAAHVLDRIAREQVTQVPEYAAREKAKSPDADAIYGYETATGHGVGFFSDLHESPPTISIPGSRTECGVVAGMVFSNEPGYYDPESGIGIRIENLLAVRTGADGLCELEDLTLAPFDTSLIDLTQMNAQEIGWLNAYHAKVRETLSPHLDEAAKDWLSQATQPIGKWISAVQPPPETKSANR